MTALASRFACPARSLMQSPPPLRRSVHCLVGCYDGVQVRNAVVKVMLHPTVSATKVLVAGFD
jgi:hypothetical protein